ncbi:ABC transporter ATP-binding protein [Deinococcus sp.]|uniref:ABC transporter ATP-binding protein n=1 Tax=Deinococcus sp. TaxID=47478 RepID=UPI003B5C5172
MTANAPAIETRNLRKEYKGRAVVQDLDLTVQQGEVFGFLGPNGAGKSTTVKMLLGLVRPTSGELRVLGGSPDDLSVRARLGFLPEQFRFQTWMTGAEFLKFHGQLAGLSASELTKRIPAVLERVGLAGRGNEALSGYSKGMLQRAGLAGAILARPRLVFLDEPTSALDPVGRVEVREIIQELRREGVTVFLNSHLLSEVEQVSDRVAFVKAGEVVRAGTLAELLAGALPVRVKVDRLTPQLLSALGALGQLESQSEQQVTVTVSGEEVIPAIASAIFASGAQLYALTPRQHDLEDLFLELVGQNGDTGQAAQLGGKVA